jgi:hypothetical protein
MQTSKVHSLSNRRRGRDKSGCEIYPAIERHPHTIEMGDKLGQQMKASKQRPLTFYQVVGEGTSHDCEELITTKGYSHSVACRARKK